MQINDQQLGTPQILYKGTKVAIEALTGILEGAIAYATDTNQLGSYSGATWTWGQGASLFSQLTADVDLNFGSFKGVSVADPTANQDIATKYYVDTHTSSGSGGAHVHGLARWNADGGTTFNLPDVAEYIDSVTNNGSDVDALTYSLSADRTQIVFDSAPTATNVIQCNYVVVVI